jgi:16S rRNA (adenine1518-N6/adenine1519-N6)-dimethyltransferase
LGQHFLIDTSAAQRIADAFGDLSQSTVLEIGAGRGALTSLLARRTRRLIAIELDRVLAAQLTFSPLISIRFSGPSPAAPVQE